MRGTEIVVVTKNELARISSFCDGNPVGKVWACEKTTFMSLKRLPYLK